MLVLSRKPQERIVLDLDFSELAELPPEDRRIEVVLLRLRRGTARLGVIAPDLVRIRRAELGESRKTA